MKEKLLKNMRDWLKEYDNHKRLALENASRTFLIGDQKA